jgi:hypothetical protein
MLQSTEKTSWLLATESSVLKSCRTLSGQLIGIRAAKEQTIT